MRDVDWRDNKLAREHRGFSIDDIAHMFAVPPWLIDHRYRRPRLLSRERFYWWRLLRRYERRSRGDLPWWSNTPRTPRSIDELKPPR
jgi:hypothetical protein